MIQDLCLDINNVAAWLALTGPPQLPESPGVIVLLGNQVVSTLTAACRLAQAECGAILLFSGGRGHSTQTLWQNLQASSYASVLTAVSAEKPEADLYKLVAQRAFAIPEERILLESASRNGGENARFSLRALQAAALSDKSLVLLQDPLMQRRSVLTWIREASNAGIVPSLESYAAFIPKVERDTDGKPRLVPSQAHGTWTFHRFLGLLLGEMERLHDDENGYGPRGRNYFDHMDIPEHVWESYRRILADPIAASAQR